MDQRCFILLVQSQGTDLSTWIALTIGGLALLYVFMRPKPKVRDPLATAPNFTLVQQRSVERQMESLLVELSNMSRQITAQLDTRAAKLELLIKHADDRLAELRLLTGQTRREAQPPQPATLVQPASECAPLPAEVPTASPPVPPPVEPDHRYDNVYALVDQGHATHEVAQHLGRPIGEIELILALRPRDGSVDDDE